MQHQFGGDFFPATCHGHVRTTQDFCRCNMSLQHDSLCLSTLRPARDVVKSGILCTRCTCVFSCLKQNHCTSISTPELFSSPWERRALGNPETKCLLIGFREEQSKASLIGAFMLARGVSRRRKAQIANFWL